MERIQALIDRLYQQKTENSNAAQLLLTVELLRSELMQLRQKNGTLGTAKVAVTLPVNMNFSEEEIRTATAEIREAVKEEPVVEIKKPVAEPVQATSPYELRKPQAEEKKEPLPQYSQEQLNPAFSLSEEIPTLQTARRELHEVISEKKESLNDKLKQEKKELAHKLKDSPIRDLRKAIGINDRFSFINELFRGDEASYERSIKTINSFNIYSEAEFWMNRELKLKMNWNEDQENVQHFYDLVRRRFS